MLNCPSCNRIIVDTTQEGGYKLRSRMVIFQDNEAYALCPTCKTNVKVPLRLDVSNIPSYGKPKHYIETAGKI